MRIFKAVICVEFDFNIQKQIKKAKINVTLFKFKKIVLREGAYWFRSPIKQRKMTMFDLFYY